jgi:hypothetical protein
MPLLSYGEWRPDLSDYEAATTQNVVNVLPRGDGYGPFPSLTALSVSLGSQCRGAFVAYKADGSVTIFAGTATDLYIMDNTAFAWTKVSKAGGPYSSVATAEQWRFVQFNTLVICVQANVAPQVYDITTSTAFADLAGSPPQARYIDIVGRFVVLSGLLTNPQRVQWSGLNDINGPTSWTPGINSADYQDLPDGGIVRGVAGGENGVILQDSAIRTMTYVAGSPIIFQIERISQDKGLFGPYSLVRAGERIFFFSAQGFHRIDPGGFPTPIGRERVDRTFFADLDKANLQLFIGAADPRNSRILWAYKSANGTTNQFDKILCYDWILDRFTPIKISGEYLLQLSQPGITLEGLDAIAPTPLTITGAANNASGLIRLTVATATLSTGQYLSVSGVKGTLEANGDWTATVIDATHIDLQGSTFANAYVSGGIVGGSLDALTTSLDDFSTSTIAEIAAFDPSHMLNFFRGGNLEATLDSAEQGTNGTRIKIRGFRPITDAPVLYGSVSFRDTQQATAVFTGESLINALTGRVNLLKSTRYARARCRIPAGTAWTFIGGIEPDFATEGQR